MINITVLTDRTGCGIDYVVIYTGSKTSGENKTDVGLAIKPLLIIEADQFEKLIEEYNEIMEVLEYE